MLNVSCFTSGDSIDLKHNSINGRRNTEFYHEISSHIDQLEKEGKLLGIVTQNIDTLHEKAKSKNVREAARKAREEARNGKGKKGEGGKPSP